MKEEWADLLSVDNRIGTVILLSNDLSEFKSVLFYVAIDGCTLFKNYPYGHEQFCQYKIR